VQPAHPAKPQVTIPAASSGAVQAIADDGSPRELVDPADEIDARRFPALHRRTAGLAQDQWEQEFETGLAQMLDRVASFVADGPSLGRG
jgi:hypothetical protein